MRHKSKKSKNYAKKLQLQQTRAKEAELNKAPDVFSSDFYFDDIDEHFIKKTQVDTIDHPQLQEEQEEVLPLSDDEEEEQEMDQGSSSDDSDSKQDEDDLKCKKYLERFPKEVESSSDEEDRALFWGLNKEVYYNDRQGVGLSERIKKMSEEECTFASMDEMPIQVKCNDNLIPLFRKRAETCIKDLATLEEPEAEDVVPVLPKPPTITVSKPYTVEEALELVKDKLDFDHKSHEENLRLIVKNLPRGCKLKGYEFYIPLKKKMEDYLANRKAKKASEQRPNLDQVPVEPVSGDEEMEEEDDDVDEEIESRTEDQQEQLAKKGRGPLPYEIAKNVGIKIYRKKENRNPRVHNKNKYRRALIKRKSKVPNMRPMPTKYTGEKFGINPLIIRSRTFK